MIWLCRTEQFTTYAYGTHAGVIDDVGSSVGEGIAIHASSEWYDVSKTLGIDRTADGKYVLFGDHYAVLPAQAENGIFLGLQRSTANLPEDSEGLFRKLWIEGVRTCCGGKEQMCRRRVRMIEQRKVWPGSKLPQIDWRGDDLPRQVDWRQPTA